MGGLINLDNLTLGQMKQILAFGANLTGNIANHLIGKYVIVRSRNEGINAGVVKAADSSGVILTEARRIWYHKPKDTAQSWYEGVANTGLSSDSKISAAVTEKVIIEDYSITLCTSEAEESIRGHKANGQG